MRSVWLPFVDTRLTNAIAEGLNRIIKIAKNRASGFQALGTFYGIIFLIVGDLNIRLKFLPVLELSKIAAIHGIKAI